MNKLTILIFACILSLPALAQRPAGRKPATERVPGRTVPQGLNGAVKLIPARIDVASDPYYLKVTSILTN